MSLRLEQHKQMSLRLELHGAGARLTVKEGQKLLAEVDTKTFVVRTGG